MRGRGYPEPMMPPQYYNPYWELLRQYGQPRPPMMPPPMRRGPPPMMRGAPPPGVMPPMPGFRRG